MGYTYKLEQIPNSWAGCGEGPHWDVATQSLYFVDVIGPALYRYDYDTCKIYKTKIDNETFSSFIIPIENSSNLFAVGVGRSVKIIEWDGTSPKCKIISNYCQVEQNDPKYNDNRFNDAKCDPFCQRLYAGTMNHLEFPTKRLGALYFCKQKNAKKIVDNVFCSNGLTWDVCTKKFYYIDSYTHDIKVYDFDVRKGLISNGKILVDFKCNGVTPDFIPDGMTIDTKGNLFVALFNGSKVLKINPSIGKVEHIIELDCPKVTSVAFGGPNLDILFITTACLGDAAPAGIQYKCTGLTSTGRPMTRFKLDLPKN